jgi:hypothetical protein
MALINSDIPNLLNGISQQPATLRLTSQGEVQVNGSSSIVQGLTKRLGTEHVGKLDTVALTATDAVYWIDRDVDNRYVVIIKSDNTLGGTSCTVYDDSGASATLTAAGGLAYLVTTNPKENLRFVTIADYTFVTNNGITCAMGATTSTGTVVGTVQTFGELPTTSVVDNKYEILGDDTNEFDNYYVIATTTTGEYVETVLPGITTTIDPATMPHQLILTAGAFAFGPATWTTRDAGDEASAPTPSFIGQTIHDVFFYKNRLSFLSQENIIMSATSEFYTFFPTTVTSVPDDQTIDVAVSHNKVSILYAAVPFNETLVLFSGHTQFVIDNATTLSPATISISATTEFKNDSLNITPVAAGPRLYFTAERGDYTSFYEYFVDTDTITKDASDISGHVPQFIPKNITKIIASSNEDILFAISSDNPTRLYTYKWYWASAGSSISGSSKVQSAWSYWEFASTDTINDIDVIGNELHVIVSRADGVFFEKMKLQNIPETGLAYAIRLDRKEELTGAYVSGTDTTTWTLPYVIPTATNMKVVKGGGWSTQKGSDITSLRPTTTTITATGDYSAQTVWVGVPYTFDYTFSTQYVKVAEVATTSGRLQLRNFSIVYEDTTFFQAKVTPLYRSEYTYTYNGLYLNEAATLLDEVKLSSGTFRFPVACKNEHATISLTSDSHLPCAFQSAEWEGFYTTRSRKI